MSNFEENRFKIDFNMRKRERYIFNCFILISKYIDHNNKDNIKFTFELEKDGSIPFLDTRISRKPEGSLKFTVYRKPTHTNQYLNFESHHPLHQKLGVVHTLFNRCDTVVSDPKDREDETTTISTALSQCGYPRWTFKRKNKTNTTQSTKDRTAQRKYPVVIPYIKGLSEAVSRIMKKHGISTTMKPCNKLRDILVHPKDKIKEMDKAQGVYKVPC